MRLAFTMIELIFVIVILGILAAVAIPKLNATRDDAFASSISQNIQVSRHEIAAFAMAQGQVQSNLASMSNVISTMVAGDDATLNVGAKSADFVGGTVSNCVTLQVQSGGGEDNLTLSFGNSGTDVICTRVQDILSDQNISILLRGRLVVQ